LFEHDEVLALIESIVMTRKLPTPSRTRTARPAVANDKKMARVMEKWAEQVKRKKPPPAELFEKPVQRAILASLIAGRKPRLVRRARPIPGGRKKRP
jgi:hypothetical protein